MIGACLRIMACACSFACMYSALRLAMHRLWLDKQKARPITMEDMLRDRTLCFLTFCAAGLLVSFATSMWLFAPSIIIAALLSKRAPSMLDERAKKELRSACDEHVDVMADIVAMGVRSGLSFDAALGLYCLKFDTRLAKELDSARLQWTSGLASRQKALMDLAARTDSKALRRFAETSLQAIHYGSPLADMLNKLSQDIRRRRRNNIERQIEKAPVKMLVPTGTCILPAMLILVMGPVMLQFIQSGY